MPFTKNTFKYFDNAKKNKNKKEWFDKNENLYKEAVREPMSELLIKIWEKFGDDLPKIDISPKKVTKPLRNKNKVSDEKSLIKLDSSFFLAEKATSRFEWNPGIYFQLGANAQEIFFGAGLYMISSRQMKKMRQGIVDDFDRFDSIMKNKVFKKRWGGLAGEVYTRFPKEYDETAAYAHYLRHKQFYVSKSFTREEIIKPNFMKEMVKDLEAVMPFFLWVRHKVGTYQAGPKFTFRDDD